MPTNKKETIFQNAIKEIFVGANIEGTSGYINLLNIKKQYFDELFPELQKGIHSDTRIDSDFREEFFDKLYNFFHRYFSESGSIYFRHTPSYQKIYEQVYSEGKDVALFWKTHMLYYVKSDVIFQSAPVEVQDENYNTFNFFIDATQIENKKSNERKDLVFAFDKVANKDNKKTIFITAQYSERGHKTKVEEIRKEIKNAGVENVSEEIIEKTFRVFNKQSEVDFFINKDARGFLKEQFDLYLYHYIFKEENTFSKLRIERIQALKNWAYEIIDFIGQFEDELVKVWKKPKFVRNTNYIITIDKISDKLIKKIEKHSGIRDQIKEWVELGMVDASFNFIKRDVEKNKHLPIDTKHFKDIEIEILEEQGNLDENLDGLLIHSENYQALNTIREKYIGQVKCIYIDPPFNLDSSDQFMYRTNYKDSNWASLLENRLVLAKELLSEDGSIFVRCDYNGNYIVRELLNQIFGSENFINELDVSRIKKSDDRAKKYNSAVDTLFFYSKTKDYLFIRQAFESNKDERWHAMDSQGQGGSLLILGKLREPPKGRHWTFGQEKIIELENQGKIRLTKKGTPQYFIDASSEQIFDSNWTDIPGYSSTTGFSTENSEVLLSRVIKTASNEGDLVMDFFAGSATTQRVAQKLGRKWIGVEMGDHFNEYTLPEIKKVLGGKQSGISKEKEITYKGSGSVKYYDLEQYEEALACTKYSGDNTPVLFDGNKSIFAQYIFNGDQKLTNIVKTQGKDIKINLEEIYPNIDVVETLSNITGKHIAKKTAETVEFIDGTVEKINPQTMTQEEKMHFIELIKSLVWWGE